LFTERNRVLGVARRPVTGSRSPLQVNPWARILVTRDLSRLSFASRKASHLYIGTSRTPCAAINCLLVYRLASPSQWGTARFFRSWCTHFRVRFYAQCDRSRWCRVSRSRYSRRRPKFDQGIPLAAFAASLAFETCRTYFIAYNTVKIFGLRTDCYGKTGKQQSLPTFLAFAATIQTARSRPPTFLTCSRRSFIRHTGI
jgi:hypothetical protein